MYILLPLDQRLQGLSKKGHKVIISIRVPPRGIFERKK